MVTHACTSGRWCLKNTLTYTIKTLSQKRKKEKQRSFYKFHFEDLYISLYVHGCFCLYVCLFKMPGPVEFRREYQILRTRITVTHLMWTSICVQVCVCVSMSARAASLITAAPSIPCKHQFNSVFLLYSV